MIFLFSSDYLYCQINTNQTTERTLTVKRSRTESEERTDSKRTKIEDVAVLTANLYKGRAHMAKEKQNKELNLLKNFFENLDERVQKYMLNGLKELPDTLISRQMAIIQQNANDIQALFNVFKKYEIERIWQFFEASKLSSHNIQAILDNNFETFDLETDLNDTIVDFLNEQIAFFKTRIEEFNTYIEELEQEIVEAEKACKQIDYKINELKENAVELLKNNESIEAKKVQFLNFFKARQLHSDEIKTAKDAMKASEENLRASRMRIASNEEVIKRYEKLIKDLKTITIEES